ncbi:MAG: prolipoprotein diacylglyceryl transferase [Candidatus Magasanikbacteria bacterium]|nr:prolipoprotein diacylglyceryl transferase [Candidatus Magasanikbacteria bacterium]
MIPYFSLISFELGPLKIYSWGLLASLGILIGLLIALQRAGKRLDAEKILNLSLLIIFLSFIGARLFYVFFGGVGDYFWANPWRFFFFWEGGLASTGGFLGAGLALLIFYRQNKKTFWPYAENLAFAFPFGWLVARLGCFLIHDHPGQLTNLFLAVNFPLGRRLDMGLMEAFCIFPLLLFFLFLGQKEKKDGFYSARLLLWYGVMRFFLDFWRAADLPGSDPRFWSLTAAQWGSAIIFFLGLTIYYKKIKRKGAGAV